MNIRQSALRVYRGRRISVKLSRLGAAGNRRRLGGKPLYFQENSPENRPRCGTESISFAFLWITGQLFHIIRYDIAGEKIPEKKKWLTSFHIFKTGLGITISAKPSLATIFRPSNLVTREKFRKIQSSAKHALCLL